MAQRSTIEWTEATWNPVRGCRKISPGCKNCFAERFAERWRGIPGHPYEQGFDLRLVPELLEQPLRWKEPRLIFVNSMSDLYQKGVPLSYVRDVFDVMAQAEQHTFQILTKRADRLAELAPKLNWPKNVWQGVSVESQKYCSRIDRLRTVPAAVRFLSVEPLLGPLLPELKGIHWVIVGGESGPGARPMQVDWVRNLRDSCRQQKVPFFFKQWGGVRKHRTGRQLDGRTWDEMPFARAV